MDLLKKIYSVIFFHNCGEESLLEILNEAIDFGIADLELPDGGFAGNVSFNDEGSFTFIEWAHVDNYMAQMYKERVFARNSKNPDVMAEVFEEASDCGPEWIFFTVVTTVKIYREDLLSLLCKN
jgi:hypothetical protein